MDFSGTNYIVSTIFVRGGWGAKTDCIDTSFTERDNPCNASGYVFSQRLPTTFPLLFEVAEADFGDDRRASSRCTTLGAEKLTQRTERSELEPLFSNPDFQILVFFRYVMRVPLANKYCSPPLLRPASCKKRSTSPLGCTIMTRTLVNL